MNQAPRPPTLDDEREAWLHALGLEHHEHELLAADASFRRYFRLIHQGRSSGIFLDAPVDLEPQHTMWAIHKGLSQKGFRVPKIYASQIDRGWFYLEDFGDRRLDREPPEARLPYYFKALDLLSECHAMPSFEPHTLQNFNGDLLISELHSFEHWMLERYLGLALSVDESSLFHHAFDILYENACMQPIVWAHRDYHSRNLMILPDESIGILDWQDAVWGPLNYDAVSLIKDCYVRLSDEERNILTEYFFEQSTPLWHVPSSDRSLTFNRMGIQRHLKASFIFARKWVRDRDPRYLQSAEQAFEDIHLACAEDLELQRLGRWIQHKGLPLLQEYNHHALASP